DALAGWDPDERRFVFDEFHSDLPDLESSITGTLRLDDDGALVRELVAREPDGARRADRQHARILGGRMESSVEGLDDAGRGGPVLDVAPWRLFGSFLGAHLGGSGAPAAGRRTDEDEQALARFAPFLGRWVLAGRDREVTLEIAWGIEDETVHVRECHTVD